MKVAVSSKGKGLDSEVDPRFGRCSCFVLVEPESGEFRCVDNEGLSSIGGAGIAAAQQVVNEGAGAVLTGDVGPNAAATLTAAGVKVFTGARGSVAEALEMFQKGELTEASGATVAPHHGAGGRGGGPGPR